MNIREVKCLNYSTYIAVRLSRIRPKLSKEEISQLITSLPGWEIIEKDGELRLEKVFHFENFNKALAFTNLVASEAIIEDHHPALLTEWGKVTVTWWTHRIKGLHQNDFIMAAKSDKIFGSGL